MTGISYLSFIIFSAHSEIRLNFLVLCVTGVKLHFLAIFFNTDTQDLYLSSPECELFYMPAFYRRVADGIYTFHL